MITCPERRDEGPLDKTRLPEMPLIAEPVFTRIAPLPTYPVSVNIFTAPLKFSSLFPLDM
jgi:hypothetical protein